MKNTLRKIKRLTTNYILRVKFSFNKLSTSDEYISFQCNICGKHSKPPLKFVSSRKKPSCYHYGSNLRFRAIIDALSNELFGESYILPNFQKTKNSGIGMSDTDNYTIPLSKKINYTNTFYHTTPKLDIANIEPELGNKYDFIITSDVFEHVPPDVQDAFNNLFKLLKNGGLCVFTVPYKLDGDTQEHFPNLYNYSIKKENNKYKLVIKTKDGHEEIFNELRFHGGPGSTLEIRFFFKAINCEKLNNRRFYKYKISQ